MAGNPRVFELLEEMLDTGLTPEEVCRDCPELLPEVRRRWTTFRRIDAEFAALLPPSNAAGDGETMQARAPRRNCQKFPATAWSASSATAAWASSTAPGTSASIEPSP